MVISSANNNQIKNILKLLKKKRERQKQGVFVIDGLREIKEALKAGIEIQAVFYCPEIIGKKIFSFSSRLNINSVSADIFAGICYKEKPDGYLALARQKIIDFTGVKLSKNPLVIVLEAVEKPGNLGAIIRSAYAAGADLIIMNEIETDLCNPNVIRASEGLIFAEQIVLASRGATINWLKENNIRSLAAATIGRAKNYTAVDLRGSAAIILGSEAEGLSSEWLREADNIIKIPMKEGVDSLNVSVSAAVIMFEAVRQRKLS